ncbi:hypothetical protein [Streptomyces sp. NPDC047974]|uniref:hypothetical protein n=1 Tax=Streptomyces sp. NPDC047974 TaxID=3154343 RepID=UPI0033F6EDC7
MKVGKVIASPPGSISGRCDRHLGLIHAEPQGILDRVAQARGARFVPPGSADEQDDLEDGEQDAQGESPVKRHAGYVRERAQGADAEGNRIDEEKGALRAADDTAETFMVS